jgi:hypothetical protein
MGQNCKIDQPFALTRKQAMDDCRQFPKTPDLGVHSLPNFRTFGNFKNKTGIDL